MLEAAARFLLLLAGLTLAAPALAQRAGLPFSLDARVIESVLRERVFSDAGARVRLNDDGSGCNYLELREPQVRVDGGRIRLRTAADIRAGRALGGQCLLLVNWRGGFEFSQVPEVAGADSVVLRTTDWQALRPDGSPDTLATTVGGWVEQFMPAELRRTRIDLAEPLGQLREVLARMVPPADAAESAIDLGSLAVDGAAVQDDRVVVTLGLDATPVGAPAAAPEPALTETELAALEQRLDALDAFFTYTAKTVDGGVQTDTSAVLLEMLIELRRELVALLGEPAGRGEDPARALFVEAWGRLAPVLRAAAGNAPDADAALRLLTFVGAGDALAVLDRLGPGFGVEISSDGLRRLARMLVPGEAGDPLEYDDAVDPALRRALGFGEPLPPPTASDDATWVDEWIGWFVSSAVAATLDAAAVQRLNNWVPKPRDMPTYLPMVRDVLAHVVAEQLKSRQLESSYHDLFRWLVFSAGWQESCWRQFTVKGDKRWPMESRSGDVGLMQVNVRVWRGLYDRQGLSWDIVYNARAGADILEHYLVDYALRQGEHKRTGDRDSLARSAYAAYNGGPSQYDRYRRGGKKAGVDVDAVFYDKYQQIKRGNDLAVKRCYGGT